MNVADHFSDLSLVALSKLGEEFRSSGLLWRNFGGLVKMIDHEVFEVRKVIKGGDYWLVHEAQFEDEIVRASVVQFNFDEDLFFVSLIVEVTDVSGDVIKFSEIVTVEDEEDLRRFDRLLIAEWQDRLNRALGV